MISLTAIAGRIGDKGRTLACEGDVHVRLLEPRPSLEGRSVLGLNLTQLTRLGVLRMFQMTRVVNRISAFDN